MHTKSSVNIHLFTIIAKLMPVFVTGTTQSSLHEAGRAKDWRGWDYCGGQGAGRGQLCSWKVPFHAERKGGKAVL